MSIPRQRILEAYYLATPVFIVVDTVLNAPVRVSFLATPAHRWPYYAFCIACGLACHRWPHSARPIAFTESSVNLLLLALSMMLPIWSLGDEIMAGGAIAPPMTTARLINVMISGTVLVISFYRTQPALRTDRGRM
ncbi:MAG: hypothetical protein L0271_00305 [Gemmatimonadetes bacterium]|nr:hypothetical protein [Gemmatimonadota bacterium]